MDRQSQRNFPLMHILPDGALADMALRQFDPYPVENPARCVPLLPRRLLVQVQNAVNENCCRRQSDTGSFGLLSGPRQCAAYRLAHHPPVYFQFLCDSGYRAHAELVLSPDLFVKLHS